MTFELPPRTANTMSDAIAMSSPSGRMSKRAKSAATKALSVALFGPNGLTREQCIGTGPVRTVEQEIAQLRSYALMAGRSQAKKLNAQADKLELERERQQVREALCASIEAIDCHLYPNTAALIRKALAMLEPGREGK